MKKGLVLDQHIAEVYADYLMVPLFDIAPDEMDPQLAGVLPEKLCRDHHFVPVEIHDDTLDVAFSTFEDMLMADELQLLTGMNIRPMMAPLSVVDKASTRSIWRPARSSSAVSTITPVKKKTRRRRSRKEDQPDENILSFDEAPPPGPDGRVIRMVNQILEDALRTGASDIHLEPFEDSCAMRLRVDGELRALTPPTKAQFVPIVSRFKILAKMDIAEKRVPQDGAIALRGREAGRPSRQHRADRVRRKDGHADSRQGRHSIELTGLGFDERQSKDLIESIQMPHGLMLVTGPTGSGKSTTLYACLNLLNEPDTNICTVEDPVEYKFKGINQVQVKTQVGLTFAGALRAFLRKTRT